MVETIDTSDPSAVREALVTAMDSHKKVRMKVFTDFYKVLSEEDQNEFSSMNAFYDECERDWANFTHEDKLNFLQENIDDKSLLSRTDNVVTGLSTQAMNVRAFGFREARKMAKGKK